jgi:peptidoglycan hydrolase CwlO-like protein
MERFERDLKGKDNAIGKLNDRMAEKDKEIQELKDKIKELEDKTVHHDN